MRPKRPYLGDWIALALIAAFGLLMIARLAAPSYGPRDGYFDEGPAPGR